VLRQQVVDEAGPGLARVEVVEAVVSRDGHERLRVARGQDVHPGRLLDGLAQGDPPPRRREVDVARVADLARHGSDELL
jgi:hypothetical protein